jgi:hypothetical protein
MLSLGVAFAQGLSYVSAEERDFALTEFLYRLRKYTGIDIAEFITAE